MRRDGLVHALRDARATGAAQGTADAVDATRRRRNPVRSTALPQGDTLLAGTQAEIRRAAFVRAIEDIFDLNDLTDRET